MSKAVFLDRDGTLNEERHYLSRPEEVLLFPDAVASLKRLYDAGFLLFIVTNQSGIGRGYFTTEDVHRVNERLALDFTAGGVHFQKIYIAPEAPNQPSRGRKPSPQFVLDAQTEYGVDLSRSYFIGDKLIDLQCGWNAGLRKCLLVRTGYGAETARSSGDSLRSAVVVHDLTAAADYILSDTGD
jgi:D-glycero-D-manno-heptose 1,7-bisphosphate phosphatase